MRPALRFSVPFCLSLTLCSITAQAAAAPPAIAVMPFRDLSGAAKGSNLGEAIRETVTTDLKEVSGLRVIERGSLDQVLREQNLQGRTEELDASSTVKVGKLVGASLIVTGAYQRSANQVRLTARFVKVETSEIVGSAKVDGAATQLFTLQDRVTAELLKSAGMSAPTVKKFTSRTRAPLKSLHSMELYGDAVVETDDVKKKQILIAALGEDAGFTYAAHDLDALEARLKNYDQSAQVAQDAATIELQKQIRSEKDPTQISIKYTQLFTQLMMARRYRALRALGRAVVKNPPPQAPPPMPAITEMAAFYGVQASSSLRDHNAVLGDGEKFIQAYPTSMYRMGVRAQMDQALEEERQVRDGSAKASSDIAALSPDEKTKPCTVAGVFQRDHQYAEARKRFEECMARGTGYYPRKMVLVNLVMAASAQGDFAAAQKYLDALEKEDADQYRSIKGITMTWPQE